MEIMLQRPLQQEALRLSPFFGDGDEFFMEFGIDFGSKFNRVGHDVTSKNPIIIPLGGQVKSYLDYSRLALRQNLLRRRSAQERPRHTCSLVY